MKKVLLFSLTVLMYMVSASYASAVSADFTAEYFTNMSLSGTPTLTRQESAINHDWVAGSPDVSIPNDQFSARWTGTITVDAGTYYFETTTDDGVRLYVDGQLVINHWQNQAPTTHSTNLALTTGDHTVVMEYFENGGGAVAQLAWGEVVGENPNGVKVMPLGDSITHGWNVPGGYRMKLMELMPDINLVGTEQNGPGTLSDKDHEGHPGWRVHEITNNVSSWLNVHQPQVILLKIGTNDVRQTGWEDTPDRLNTLINQITSQQPDVELLVSNLIPMSNPSDNDRIIIINQGIAQIISQQQAAGKKVYFVDMYNTVTTADLADGVHPSLSGYNKMGSKWAAALQGVVDDLPAPTPTPTPDPIVYPDPSEDYFIGEYFNNLNLSGEPTLVRQDQTITFNWGGGSPDQKVSSDNFSVRWSKPHTFAEGSYRFTATADDGIRVIVDGQTVIDEWVDQAPTTYTQEITLTSGQHQIVVEYYEKGGGATAQVNWEQLSTTIPTPTPTPNPTPTPTPSEGYSAAFFSNTTLSGTPILTRTDQEIDFDWGGGSPDPAVANDTFSARWLATEQLQDGKYRFTVTADDGVRIYLDDVIILDRWKDQAPTTYTVDRNIVAGVHTLKIEYYEKGGGAVMKFNYQKIGELSQNDPGTPQDIPSDAFLAEYFNNMNLTGNPVLTQTEPSVNFDWGASSPDASIPNDNFSARWSRKLIVTEQGSYKFKVTGDDGVRLQINGQKVIDQWKDQGPTEYTTTQILPAGEHLIVMEYYERGGGAVAKLSWENTIVSQQSSTPQGTSAIPTDAYLTEYFNNITLSGNPVLTTQVSAVDFDWVLSGPTPELVDNFSARWQSRRSLAAGTYRFSVTADDGVRLKVNGQTIIDQWKDQGPTTYTHDLALPAGEHVIVMEYYERAVGALAKLDWQQL